MSDLWRRLAGPAMALALLAGGCSDDDSGDDSPPSEPAAQAGASTLRQRPVGLDVRIARMAGHLPRAEARDLSQRMGRVVATWINGGFLAGDYPRTKFAGYASFTPDAARLAQRSSGVTSNVRLGKSWQQVVPTRQKVRLFIFAPAHRPSGATAQVELVMVGIDTAGEVSELAVTGDLYLTKTDAGWRIFGFDLRRSVGEPGAYVARLRALQAQRAKQQEKAKQQAQQQDKQRKQRHDRDQPRSDRQEKRR